jgi:hypothetical protein
MITLTSCQDAALLVALVVEHFLICCTPGCFLALSGAVTNGVTAASENTAFLEAFVVKLLLVVFAFCFFHASV